MKVSIDRDRDGWFYGTRDAEGRIELKSQRARTYDEIVAQAVANGHEIDNVGWKHKLLMWNWHNVALDRYPGWEMEHGAPAWCKLEHVNKRTKSSDDLSNAWDDVAKAQFYSRDWSLDGSCFVNDGERYRSGWWFRTIAERNRFLDWVKTEAPTVKVIARNGAEA